MQTQFVFRHMDSSDALRNYAEERLSKIKRYFADPLKVNCTLVVEKIHHIAQFDVTLRNGLQLHASEKTENMYSSIDMALAKMERQVRRYKDRITAHKPHKGRVGRVSQAIIAAESFDEPDLTGEAGTRTGIDAPVASEAESSGSLVHEKQFRAERLTVGEAIMQLNLMHKQFLVFTNTASSNINVIYRLENGDYGLIETHGHVEEPS